MSRPSLKTLLKVIVTVGGLLFIILAFDLGQIIATFAQANLFWIAVGTGLTVFSLYVRAYRWWLLLRGLDATVPLRRLINLYFVGNFFNAFLPSGFGGDAVRVAEATKDVPVEIAAGTVIVDRLTGLMSLFALALVALPWRPSSFPASSAGVIALVALVGLLGGLVLLDGRLIRRFGGWLPGPLSPIGDGVVSRTLAAVRGIGRRGISQALGVSLLFNVVQVGWWVAAGESLDLPLPMLHYLLAAPIMALSLLVPSVSGLGFRESLAPLLFAVQGVTAEQAVTLSLIVFLMTRISSLFGAPVYLWSLRRRI